MNGTVGAENCAIVVAPIISVIDEERLRIQRRCFPFPLTFPFRYGAEGSEVIIAEPYRSGSLAMVELEEDRITRYCQALAFAEQQAGQLVERRPDFLPMFTTQGHWQSDNAQPLDWSEGFLAGLLWQLFRRTGDARWQDLAERYARLVEPRQHDTHSYDLGMIFLHSHLPWYELTNDRRVRSVLFAAGTTLAQRFHYRGRFFSSGANRESLSITMMMNVPLIQWVANTRWIKTWLASWSLMLGRRGTNWCDKTAPRHRHCVTTAKPGGSLTNIPRWV